jgi:hypothetical protein
MNQTEMLIALGLGFLLLAQPKKAAPAPVPGTPPAAAGYAPPAAPLGTGIITSPVGAHRCQKGQNFDAWYQQCVKAQNISSTLRTGIDVAGAAAKLGFGIAGSVQEYNRRQRKIKAQENAANQTMLNRSNNQRSVGRGASSALSEEEVW